MFPALGGFILRSPVTFPQLVYFTLQEDFQIVLRMQKCVKPCSREKGNTNCGRQQKCRAYVCGS